MRILVLIVGIVLGNSALAADAVWMTEDVQSKRFLGDEVVGPFFATGTRLDVLFREGDWVRVRKGEDYGWVEAKAVSEEEPIAPAPDAPAEPAKEE